MSQDPNAGIFPSKFVNEPLLLQPPSLSYQNPLSCLRVVIQSNANRTPMVSIVLPNDLLAMQFPQPRVVVGARCNQVRRISTESAIPNPALVACKGGLQGKWFGFLVILLWCQVFDLPDLGRMISAAGGKLLDVWGQEDSCDVFFMGVEMCNGEELGAVEGLDQLPDEDIALCPRN